MNNERLAKELYEVDRGRAMWALDGLIRGSEHGTPYFCLLVGPPQAKQRARVTRHGSYTPQETQNAEALLAFWLRQACGGQRIEGSVAMATIFYMPDRKRRDKDNLEKTVLDAGNQAGLWKDDAYVRAGATFVEYDPDRPRTLVAWCGRASSMDSPPKKGRASKELS